MNKALRITLSIAVMGLLFASCGNNNPRNRGIEAGKAACKCYQLEGFEAVESCLKEIERNNAEFLDDTAYTNAMEEEMIRCANEGVIDIVKPIKEASK